MQFFRLLSFVAVVSHAAALPQPAGLSDKYSSNVDITLASFLEARSYQPVLDPQEDSATLVSLKRRDDSDGSDPPPLLTPDDIYEVLDHFFKKGDLSSANITATIDRVGDGAVGFYKEGEKAGKEIGGTAGPLLTRYLDRFVYVIVALGKWIESEAKTIFDTIRLVLGDEEHSKIIREFSRMCRALTTETGKKEDEAAVAILNIVAKVGTDIQNVETIGKLFDDAFDSRIKFIDLLRSPLKDSGVSKALYENMFAMIISVSSFIAEQQRIHDAIMKELKPPPPK
ncbi:hypothetical protein BASA50_004748 [Batrachochytrium salamandrivorans]|uniref:Uncharacterized protein n=1 Tax=Batrachochytrium salamandrivorans TaxID=1357716 RepID=A0ABQ8FEL2_9FUNG|nr:hypothetical protein BASA60_008185 [Batrachochytrium salamandrivorans]KAH6596990.1 hypothetical protein BASA50_004748 [Batrachochytrium salamandrivorans]KAH9273467.1 hypothetical protein BASA83_004133 [Batrachochytrium salamandrivorans]